MIALSVTAPQLWVSFYEEGMLEKGNKHMNNVTCLISGYKVLLEEH